MREERMDPERLGQLTSTRDARPRGRRTRLAHHLQRALGDAEELTEVRARIEQPLGVLDLLMSEAITGALRGNQRHSEASKGKLRHSAHILEQCWWEDGKRHVGRCQSAAALALALAGAGAGQSPERHWAQSAAEIEVEIDEIGELLWLDEGEGGPGTPRTPGTPGTMDEELGFRGEVEVDHVVEQRHVDATRRYVGHNQNLRLARSELP